MYGKYMDFTIEKCVNDTYTDIVCKPDVEIEEFV